MPYTFGKNEKLQDSVRRIMILGLKDALAVLSLSQGLHKEQFKQARKAIKKVRAVLKLVQDGIRENIYEREDDTLKSIARAFREVRDVHVVEECFQRLLDRFKKEINGDEFGEIRKALFSFSQETIATVFSKESNLRKAIANLQAALERADEFSMKSNQWEIVSDGIKSTYRDTYEAYLLSDEDRDNSAFVDWRKAVKYLRYQLDFLTEFTSAEVRDYNRELHQLSDLLGEYQDLQMIMEIVQQDRKRFGGKTAVAQLDELVQRRKDELIPEALERGKRLFAQPPKDFAKWVRNTSKNWPKAA